MILLFFRKKWYNMAKKRGETMEKSKLRNIVVIVFLALVLIISVSLVISKKNDSKENNITVTISAVKKNYLVGESNNESYIITNYKGDYKENDKVKFTYKLKDKKTKDGVVSIAISDEDLILTTSSKNNTKVEEQERETSTSLETENDKASSTNPSQEEISTTETVQTVGNSSQTSTDSEVLTYVNNMKNNNQETLKESFITIVDFIFYNGQIKGHTFSELSASAKLKVLETALYLDTKINKYFPNYKEEISSKTGRAYNTVKSKVVSSYLNITSSICTKDATTCELAKEDFQTMKKNFGITWSLIKEIATDSKNNIKNWYEIWSGKK